MRKGRSTGKPNKAEAARIVAAKEGPCIACYSWFGGNIDMCLWGCDYHHTKSGNVRRGHANGFGMCLWHHRGIAFNGDAKATRTAYGPSLMDGSRLFHETYGSDDELIELQTKLIS